MAWGLGLAPMASSADPGVEVQRQQISLALAEALKLIEKLPQSLPLGTAEGSIAENFGSFNIDDEEGPFFTVNHAWERTFQTTGEAAITQGQYGIKLVHDFLLHFLHIPGIEAHGSLNLMLGQVHQLTTMLQKLIVPVATKAKNTGSSNLKIKLTKNANKGTSSNKQAAQQGEQDDAVGDPNYEPPRQDPPSPTITNFEDGNHGEACFGYQTGKKPVRQTQEKGNYG
ncbi:hypothetical protein PAXRUDRAFT_776864 [Paxillus rubicundulus Ve08.2h10]|uniref:Uncharacterized protein n=1 Tax=Paxillus rubicundulus Ve08.2h10 TaxID=930991 RepID=A0A0D0C3C3_9AGAM|nr:hypothetical protein PAXRUDRAFT_776864 [Paxillus rubicundulus Ve08.2h10]